jgi:pimeloyl-ACP methyl ester carboxylesterase
VEIVGLPVGFETFHRQAFVNYQLNRTHALGFADGQELRVVAAEISSPADCVRVFDALSRHAEVQERLYHAIGYQRLAEFFTPGRCPEKLTRYRHYRDLFDAGFAVPRHDVPYAGSSLPAYRLPTMQNESRGAVIVHGGFDSLIEEFFAIWQRIAAAGFDVIAFDGPGQGGARRLGGLTFEHDWEKPLGAVLDYFALASAGLVGISMGGYWALRAAGRESRIDRVVAWPPVYDWMLRAPRPLRAPARVMLRQQRFMRWSVRARARFVPTLRLVVDQALYNVDSTDPAAVVEWFRGMNPEHLASGRVVQDVLLMVGEHDAFQPPLLADAQAAALTNARSVTVRTFSARDHADHHCQIGNVALACDVLTDWLSQSGSQTRR